MKAFAKLVGLVAAIGLLALVMAYLAGFFEPKIAPEAATLKLPQPDGELITIAAISEAVVEQASGTLRAKNETAISPRITATVVSVNVRAGDAVNADDVLITLDSRELNVRVEQQLQAVAAAEARLSAAEPNFERIQSLFQRKVASQAEFDQVQSELRAAQAELTRSRRQVEEAQTSLSYSVIKAPINGRVIDRLVEPGDLALPGTLMLKLYDPNTLRLEANVRESLAASLSKGDPLTAHIDAVERDYTVSVDEIVPSADPGSRSFLVKVSLPEQNNLYPGMFGRLLIPSGESEKLYIPTATVKRVGQLEFVMVAVDNGLARRYIRTGGVSRNGDVEVLSGLSTGERICCQ